jgi:hypothetical protein
MEDDTDVPTTNAPLVEKPKQLEEEERDLSTAEVEELLALVKKNHESEVKMMQEQHQKEVDALRKEVEDLKAKLAAATK